jgi:hypothetical protein
MNSFIRREPSKLDYASDEGPKRNVWTLIKMASGINEKYFLVTHPLIVGSTISITLYPVTKDSLDLRKGIEGNDWIEIGYMIGNKCVFSIQINSIIV